MNIEAILNQNILYYPNIEFENEAWVKAALCIWENIYRIVPGGYFPNDSHEIQVAVQEGIIKNVYLNNQEIGQASQRFLDFMENITDMPAGFIGCEEDVINLNSQKIDATLYPYLRDLSTKIDGDWLALYPEIAHGYMLFLADIVSKKRNMPKLTDNSNVFSIMTYFDQEANFDEWVYHPNREDYYSSIVFPMFVPGGVTRVDIDQILKFREVTSESRAIFRNTIEEFVTGIQIIDSREYAFDLARSLENKLISQKRSLIDRSKSKAISLIPSLLAVGVPTSLTALGVWGLEGDPFEQKKILNSAAIGAISSIANSVNKKFWKPDSASYYLKLNNRFNDGEKLNLAIPRFDKYFEEFMND
jgi:hypothetical protein